MKKLGLVYFACAVTLVGGGAAHAQPSAEPGPFITIGSVGNRGWDRPDVPTGSLRGRGAVAYEYRIAEGEVTTAQWVAFINAVYVHTNLPIDVGLPVFWGAEVDPTYSGPGMQFRPWVGDPQAGRFPVTGITWLEAAMYCNWLHNGRSEDLASITNGVYDVFDPTQETRHPGARYWIPSHDEWLKAAYYDPAADRWNLYSTGSDQPAPGGLPGAGDANVAFRLPDYGEYRIPTGSYPQTRSPWGLLDTAGSAKEFTETLCFDPGPPVFYLRAIMGSNAGGPVEEDYGGSLGVLDPDTFTLYMGLRIAAAVESSCAACAADYDGSGGVDGDDIVGFFGDWQQGAECADVDDSGGVDGDDIASFFGVWQAGGC